ncbi:MAG: TIGR00730 family Rossman fold protein [Aliarcobacter sp.]|nr:TIGR00730 family Rossman fold protein [Aliarcobacter sp.]
MNVAIYCGSSLGNSTIYEKSTKLLAQKLSEKNFNIVYGGSKQGLMGIISNESLKLNNNVTGVITYDLVSKELENKDISKIYKVDTMNQRKEKMAELADAFIAIPGGYGTLEEIFDVIASAQLGYHKKPCAFFNINGYYTHLIEFLRNSVKEGFIGNLYVDMIIVSDDVDEIIEKISTYSAPKNKWEK